MIQCDTFRYTDDTLYIVLSVYSDVLCIKGKTDPKSRANSPLPGHRQHPAPCVMWPGACLSTLSTSSRSVSVHPYMHAYLCMDL